VGYVVPGLFNSLYLLAAQFGMLGAWVAAYTAIAVAKTEKEKL
jgi:hypothetical protein